MLIYQKCLGSPLSPALVTVWDHAHTEQARGEVFEQDEPMRRTSYLLVTLARPASDLRLGHNYSRLGNDDLWSDSAISTIDKRNLVCPRPGLLNTFNTPLWPRDNSSPGGEAQATSGEFRGEEWIEDLTQGGFIHSHAIVGDINGHEATGSDIGSAECGEILGSTSWALVSTRTVPWRSSELPRRR
jgi:hypothetical protein